MQLTREKYCEFLFKSQINYTGTYLVEHWKGVNKNAVYHFLKNANLSPEDIWEWVKGDIIPFSFFNSLIILFSLCFFANFGRNIFSKSVLIRVICGEYFNNS